MGDPLQTHLASTGFSSLTSEHALDESGEIIPSIRAPRDNSYSGPRRLPEPEEKSAFQRWKQMLTLRFAPRLAAEGSEVLARYSNSLGSGAGEILAKNTAKLAPLVGAIPSAIAVKDMFFIAKDSEIPEARYLAKVAMALNAGDVALSVMEPFVAEAGLPVVADVALGSAELWLELTIADIEQQPNFRASDELKTTIGIIALRNPVQAFPELAREFGIEGAKDILGTTARSFVNSAREPLEGLYQRLSE